MTNERYVNLCESHRRDDGNYYYAAWQEYSWFEEQNNGKNGNTIGCVNLDLLGEITWWCLGDFIVLWYYELKSGSYSPNSPRRLMNIII